MLEWNCGKKDVKKRVTSAPDLKCLMPTMAAFAQDVSRLQFGDQHYHLTIQAWRLLSMAGARMKLLRLIK